MSEAIDYNDGKIHVWSGGECPVHPKSTVELSYGWRWIIEVRAETVGWSRSQPFLFRVTKQHIEPVAPPKPLEMWVNVYADGSYGKLHATEQEALDKKAGICRTVRMHDGDTMTTTPDYNDGEWHAWSGGECPVHPETLIEIFTPDANFTDRRAGITHWAGNYGPFLFRVTKQHIEPLELWVNIQDNGWVAAYNSATQAAYWLGKTGRTVHMREVTE